MNEQEKKEKRPLFSKDERHKIVRSFIDAYLRGSVKVRMPTRETFEGQPEAIRHIESAAKKMGTDFEGAFPHLIIEAISVVTGAQRPESIASTVQEHVDMLFRIIVACRTGNRLEGSFLEVPEVERRVQSLERRVEDIEALLEELRLSDRVRRDSNP